MKTALCLILLSLVSLSFAADKVTDTTNYLLTGTWYTTNNTIPKDLTYYHCCLPQGVLTVTSQNNGTLQVQASSWSGDVCAILNIDNTTVVQVPFNNASNYQNVSSPGTVYNNIDIGFSFSSFNGTQDFKNGSQQILVNLGLDYSLAQDFYIHNTSCATTVSKKSKSGEIIKVFGATFVALSALFMF